MKAAQFGSYGGPEVITINEITKPTPLEKQVLIEVHAASINPFDYKLRRGYMKDMMPLQLPLTIGGDLSGVVLEVGSEIVDFKVGDEVFGQSYAFAGGSGAIAEFAVASVGNIAIKPKNIGHIQSGSLPLVGVSAIQALEQHINLAKGQKILIHGGAGGIGSIAIQLAKHIGAYVATTATGQDLEFVKNLGADEVIDYRKEKFAEKLSGFDAVYDTVGGETTDRSFKVLKRGGILVSMLGESSKDLAGEYEVKVIGQNTETNSRNLLRLAELVDQGVIKPQVNKVFPLEQTKEAFEYVETGHPTGKVVISIKETKKNSLKGGEFKMKKFIVLYTSSKGAWEGMKNASPEDMKKGMETWMAWAKRCGEGLVDMGTPLGNGQKVTKSGSMPSEGIIGYSILQAENMEGAKTLLEGHPHLDWAEGCEIEVYECLPVPGM